MKGRLMRRPQHLNFLLQLLLPFAAASCIEGLTPRRTKTTEKKDRPYLADVEIRRDPTWDTIRSLKSESLSADLEQNAGFRELQTSGQINWGCYACH